MQGPMNNQADNPTTDIANLIHTPLLCILPMTIFRKISIPEDSP